MSGVTNDKIIFDPLWGIIDISEFLPMIDTPEFQALGFKYQLGINHLLFPSATHTRKQHSFGALKRTRDLAERWVKHGTIDAGQARTMTAFGLWHDIGHGPFSHVTEAVAGERFGTNHDHYGAKMVDGLRPAVEAAGVDFDALKGLFTHQNPLYRGVHDKNLGAEKLDYLARDAYYTLGEHPEVEYLAGHTYFIDDDIMVDEKAIDQAKSIQRFYVKMFKLVYFRKNSAIVQRMIQKMTDRVVDEAGLSEPQFWALTDYGLLALFERSADPMVRENYRRFTSRDLPKTAIELRLADFAGLDKDTGKAKVTLGISEAEMDGLANALSSAAPSVLGRIEDRIEQIAGLTAGSVVVVPPTGLERFVPQDLTVYTGRAPAKLSDYFSGHFDSLREEGRSYMTLRVCAPDAERKVLSRPETAAAVRDYLLTLAA